MTIAELFDYTLIELGEFSVSVYSIVAIIVIMLITTLLLKGIKKALFSSHRFIKLDDGNSFALYQIVKYLLWVIAIALIFDLLGIRVTVLIAGSAALLVGVGLGLQHTFNDFISGLILISESTIKVGDVLEIEDDVVLMKKIGLRTSIVLNRDDISVIIPNSLITSKKVINWSHQSRKTRFKIKVSIAYGSDVDKVIEVLEESAAEHTEVQDKTDIKARFIDFGNSSLDFELLFFSKNIFRIEAVKSDIRKIINRKFIENDIHIPFPQMDVYIKEHKQH